MIKVLLDSGDKVSAKNMMVMQKDVKDSYLETDLFLWTGLVRRVMKDMAHSQWLTTERSRLLD